MNMIRKCNKFTFIKLFQVGLLLTFFASCRNLADQSDAYGNFESTEVTVSSEVTGRILELNIEEGQQIKKGQRWTHRHHRLILKIPSITCTEKSYRCQVPFNPGTN